MEEVQVRFKGRRDVMSLETLHFGMHEVERAV